MNEPKLVYQPSQTGHWKNLFPNKMMLLGSQNLNPGEELVVTITGVSFQEIKDQKGKSETVPVMKFENAPPMVLNITNTRTVSALYGDIYTNWQGKQIQVFAAEIKAFGAMHTALRVRPVIPTQNMDLSQYESQLRACKNGDELKRVFMSLPNHIKASLTQLKDEIKGKLNV